MIPSDLEGDGEGSNDDSLEEVSEGTQNVGIQGDEDLGDDEGAQRPKRTTKTPAWHKDYEVGPFE